MTTIKNNMFLSNEEERCLLHTVKYEDIAYQTYISVDESLLTKIINFFVKNNLQIWTNNKPIIIYELDSVFKILYREYRNMISLLHDLMNTENEFYILIDPVNKRYMERQRLLTLLNIFSNTYITNMRLIINLICDLCNLKYDIPYAPYIKTPQGIIQEIIKRYKDINIKSYPSVYVLYKDVEYSLDEFNARNLEIYSLDIVFQFCGIRYKKHKIRNYIKNLHRHILQRVYDMDNGFMKSKFFCSICHIDGILFDTRLIESMLRYIFENLKTYFYIFEGKRETYDLNNFIFHSLGNDFNLYKRIQKFYNYFENFELTRINMKRKFSKFNFQQLLNYGVKFQDQR